MGWPSKRWESRKLKRAARCDEEMGVPLAIEFLTRLSDPGPGPSRVWWTEWKLTTVGSGRLDRVESRALRKNWSAARGSSTWLLCCRTGEGCLMRVQLHLQRTLLAGQSRQAWTATNLAEARGRPSNGGEAKATMLLEDRRRCCCCCCPGALSKVPQTHRESGLQGAGCRRKTGAGAGGVDISAHASKIVSSTSEVFVVGRGAGRRRLASSACLHAAADPASVEGYGQRVKFGVVERRARQAWQAASKQEHRLLKETAEVEGKMAAACSSSQIVGDSRY